jgi:lipopolysaccharide/colanic/teichoic acid biosynthesis glycosyltransferase
MLWGYSKKRLLDFFASLFGLVLLTPLFVAVAVAIKTTSKGPVFYWQKRVGWDCKEFDFPKFRSMRTDSDQVREKLLATNQHGAEGVTFKMKNDPRVTSIGRFIRKYSIDELPQLWCVLVGEMSLVGPRPPLPSEVARYSKEQKMRLMAIPGLTGIWQVSGRSEVPFEEQFAMDMNYIMNYSMRLDINILFKTIPAVLKSKGAY